jgi:hypothetical protein
VLKNWCYFEKCVKKERKSSKVLAHDRWVIVSGPPSPNYDFGDAVVFLSERLRRKYPLQKPNSI